jgi:hypothetical protein
MGFKLNPPPALLEGLQQEISIGGTAAEIAERLCARGLKCDKNLVKSIVRKYNMRLPLADKAQGGKVQMVIEAIKSHPNMTPHEVGKLMGFSSAVVTSARKILGMADREKRIKLAPLRQIPIRCEEVGSSGLSIVDLHIGQCRYAYGNSPFNFCGEAVAFFSPYCPEHSLLCFRPHWKDGDGGRVLQNIKDGRSMGIKKKGPPCYGWPKLSSPPRQSVPPRRKTGDA